MGLFIGASILTIIELCDFTFHTIYAKLLYMKHKIKHRFSNKV